MLTKARCRECCKSIMVARSTPDDDADMATGMPANRWGGDRQRDYFVGWICNGCAFARVGDGLPGAISGPDFEFHY